MELKTVTGFSTCGLNAARTELQRYAQRRGQVIGNVGENVSIEVEILLTGAPIEVCEHCYVSI
jgi:hypothetical protein